MFDPQLLVIEQFAPLNASSDCSEDGPAVQPLGAGVFRNKPKFALSVRQAASAGKHKSNVVGSGSGRNGGGGTGTEP
jgi:hypothetical protein